MARVRRASADSNTNSLIASATVYGGRIERIYRGMAGWQNEAWRHYDICPELRFGANWVGNAMSRLNLYSAVLQPDGSVARSTDANEKAILADLLDSGPEGATGKQHAFGVHLTVAGECYLVGRRLNGGNVWSIVGVKEMKVNGRNWTIDHGNGEYPITLQDNDVVIRVWRPHPAAHLEADSPVRALLPVLSEIENLTRHIFAQTQSRLAGSGIFVLPQGAQFPPPPNKGGEDAPANNADSFMRTLNEAMTAPLTDAGSPSSVVPIVITVPDELVEKMKEPIHFWSPFDEAAVLARKEAVERLCVGMDMPPEIIKGMTSGGSSSGGRGTGASHWTSWQIEESAIKLHIEPLAVLVTTSVGNTYYREATQNKNAVIGIDSSALKLRPDRSKEALELYDRGELKAESVRRENGFDETDVMDDNEHKRWLITKVASGSATPDQVQEALKLMGVDLGPLPSDQGPTREARPAPSLVDLPVRPGPPGTNSALIAASEALVFRALERAGNRMRTNSGVKPSCPAAETYMYVKANGSSAALLEDAWTWVPQVVEGYCTDANKLTAVLDTYCQMLFTEQTPHTRERLVRHLNLLES